MRHRDMVPDGQSLAQQNRTITHARSPRDERLHKHSGVEPAKAEESIAAGRNGKRKGEDSQRNWNVRSLPSAHRAPPVVPASGVPETPDD
jgi:hypothetical protein